MYNLSMQIKLGNAFMWFLPNARIHLSDENPGPIQIDQSSLNTEEQKLITIGIATGQIVVSGFTKEEPKQEGPAVIVSQDNINNIHERDHVLAGRLQAVLNKRIPNLKKEIGLINDPRSLVCMIDLEKNGKARKDILLALNKKLEAIHNSVLASIKEIDTNATADQLDKLSKAFVADIIDIEETVVSIPLDE